MEFQNERDNGEDPIPEQKVAENSLVLMKGTNQSSDLTNKSHGRQKEIHIWTHHSQTVDIKKKKKRRCKSSRKKTHHLKNIG